MRLSGAARRPGALGGQQRLTELSISNDSLMNRTVDELSLSDKDVLATGMGKTEEDTLELMFECVLVR